MPRYFVPSSSIANGVAIIEGPTAHHIATSRRTRRGDIIEVVDDGGTAFVLRVSEATDRMIQAEVLTSAAAAGEPSVDIVVIQALIKDGMDEAVDFMTACGVSGIIPALTEHVVVRLGDGKSSRKTERWQEIARQSAQVAYRARVPVVQEVVALGEALALAGDRTLLACAMTDGAVPLPEVHMAGGERIALVVGPEGGLSGKDLAILHEAGARAVHLGPRVLRARFAGGFATAICMSVAKDLSQAPEAMAT